MNNIRRRMLFSALKSIFFIYKTGSADVNAQHAEYSTVSITENGIIIAPPANTIPRGMTISLYSSDMAGYEKLVVTAAKTGSCTAALGFSQPQSSLPSYAKAVTESSFSDFEFPLADFKDSHAVLSLAVSGTGSGTTGELTVYQIYLA